jgi:hypothetical protein
MRKVFATFSLLPPGLKSAIPFVDQAFHLDHAAIFDRLAPLDGTRSEKVTALGDTDQRSDLMPSGSVAGAQQACELGAQDSSVR